MPRGVAICCFKRLYRFRIAHHVCLNVEDAGQHRPRCFISLLKATSRVSPDKAVSVLNLAKAIEKVMKARGIRNILMILRPFCFATWKIAPAETVAGLVSISDFIFEVLALCPNTQLPRNKLKNV